MTMAADPRTCAEPVEPSTPRRQAYLAASGRTHGLHYAESSVCSTGARPPAEAGPARGWIRPEVMSDVGVTCSSKTSVKPLLGGYQVEAGAVKGDYAPGEASRDRGEKGADTAAACSVGNISWPSRVPGATTCSNALRVSDCVDDTSPAAPARLVASLAGDPSRVSKVLLHEGDTANSAAGAWFYAGLNQPSAADTLQEIQWLGNAMRTISGAADFYVPKHPLVDLVFERLVDVVAAPHSDMQRMLFHCKAERHSVRLLHFLWSLCVYNYHLHPKFPSILETCCMHGRLEYAAQCLLHFRSPAFIPFQTADAIMHARRGDDRVADFLPPRCRNLMQAILMGVKPSCSTWASSFLSPHPLFLKDFAAALHTERVQHTFVGKGGLSFLHVQRVDEEWVEDRRLGVVLVDSARQPRDCNCQVLPRSCMGGHMMHNRLLNRLGWRAELVFQDEWDSLPALRRRMFLQGLKDKLLSNAATTSPTAQELTI